MQNKSFRKSGKNVFLDERKVSVEWVLILYCESVFLKSSRWFVYTTACARVYALSTSSSSQGHTVQSEAVRIYPTNYGIIILNLTKAKFFFLRFFFKVCTLVGRPALWDNMFNYSILSFFYFFL